MMTLLCILAICVAIYFAPNLWKQLRPSTRSGVGGIAFGLYTLVFLAVCFILPQMTWLALALGFVWIIIAEAVAYDPNRKPSIWDW